MPNQLNLQEYDPICPECGKRVLIRDRIIEWRYCSIFADGSFADSFELEMSKSSGCAVFICDDHNEVIPIKGEPL